MLSSKLQRLLLWRGARTHEGKPLTLDDILKIGLGELRLTPDELYEFSMNEFHCKLEGHRHIQNLKSKEAWEIMREHAFICAAYSGNMKKGSTKLHLMPFSWDKEKPKSRLAGMNKEERIQRIKEMEEQAQQAIQNFLNSKN